MNDFAREKLYDLYAISKGEMVPNRENLVQMVEPIIAQENSAKKNILHKVLKKFYKNSKNKKTLLPSESTEIENFSKKKQNFRQTTLNKTESINILGPSPVKSVKKAPDLSTTRTLRPKKTILSKKISNSKPSKTALKK